VEVKFDVPGEGGREATLALAALLAVGLFAGSIVLLRRRSGAGQVVAALPAGRDAAGLIDALARLDARFAGREADVGAAAWSEYVVQRAELKAALDAAMAARPPMR
jgi:hypothetical protein